MMNDWQGGIIPRLPSDRRHIGMVIMEVESSSTILDLPVPEELTMQVDLAYATTLGLRRSEMVSKRAIAALPLKS
jgi:hypothetical protein